MWIEHSHGAIKVAAGSLNPYSNGMRIELISCDKADVGDVLILILMECG